MQANTQNHSKRKRGWIIWSLLFGLPLYILSVGPVAWAVNNYGHPAYLPEEVMCIYLPLIPLCKIEPIGNLFYWYTAIVWGGFPAGYTTL